MFDTAECVDGEIVACNSCSHWIATAAAASAAAEDGADRAIRLLLGLAISQYRMLSIASTSQYREREDRPTDRPTDRPCRRHSASESSNSNSNLLVLVAVILR